jgi:ABC-type dipeptide/oligopeptide/nickel transport system permease component
MISYTIRRLLGIIVTLLLLSLGTFILSRTVPGGPWLKNAEVPMSDAEVAIFKAKYGLDKPIIVQYGVWLWNAVRLDFGRPFTTPELSVMQLIFKQLPYSALIGGLSAALAILVGVILGTVSAARSNGTLDNFVVSYAVIIGTVPSFVLGFLLVFFISAKLHWLPAGGWGGPRYWILPILAYGVPATGGVTLWTRQCMLDAMTSDYVRTAYAKGVSERFVMLRHVLRNSMIPMITSFLPMFPGMMTGSIFIEQVFGLPGLGKYFWQASSNRDYPLVLGITMFWAILIAATYFITDILYGVIDPRVRITEKKA